MTLSCTLKRETCSYDIVIRSGLLEDTKALAHTISPFGRNVALITDETVRKLYGESMATSLSALGLPTSLFSFPPGEQSKTRDMKAQIEDEMLSIGFGKSCCILALGGGIVTDVAGFVAATYCRGVPLVLFPTSLIGMVDAAIGGKVGLNTRHGKNMIGAIYQPKKVLIDPKTLSTLSEREIKNGIVETLKHGLIADRSLFNFASSSLTKFLRKEPISWEELIMKSCFLKKNFVEQDEKDQGVRQFLNFGHTVGHALEIASNHMLSHGEAVAIGMVVESCVLHKLGLLAASTYTLIVQAIEPCFPDKALLNLLVPSTILSKMVYDKKSKAGEIVIAGIGDIGIPLSRTIHPPLMNEALSEVLGI